MKYSENYSFLLIRNITLILLLSILFSCRQKAEKQQVVARIDNAEITDQDLRAQFQIKQATMDFAKAENSVKQAVLDEMIDQQLILMEAYRLKYDKNTEIINLVHEKEKELAADEFINKEINMEAVSENLAKEYYALMTKVFDISFIKLNGGQSDREKEQVLKRATEIYQQLKAGADFHQSAATLSEHGSAAADSGKFTQVNCFDLEKTLIKRLHDMKVGEISEPISATDAVFILRLDHVATQKLADYSVVRPDIMDELDRMYQNIRTQKTIKIEMALKKQYHYSLLSDQMDFFCHRTQNMKSRSDTLNLFDAKEKLLPLSKTDFNVITIGDFLPKVVEYYWDSLPQKRVVEMLLDYMNGKRIFKYHAMQQKLHESKKVKDQLSVSLVQTLKWYIVNKEVLEKISVSDSDLLKCYERQKSTFQIPPQVTVQEIFCRSKADIDNIHAMAVAKKDFAVLQKRYSQDEETRTNGILGPFSKGRNGKLGERAFSGMKAGDISEPFRYRGGYSFFKLLACAPEKVESFASVKDKIKTKYVDENRDKYVNEWLKEIRKNYQIQIYPLP